MKTNYLVGFWGRYELCLERLCNCSLHMDADNQVLTVSDTNTNIEIKVQTWIVSIIPIA